MPRSEQYFVRATYVPRTCDVPVTIPWRISDISVLLKSLSRIGSNYSFRKFSKDINFDFICEKLPLYFTLDQNWC